jgi:hypothetical protein
MHKSIFVESLNGLTQIHIDKASAPETTTSSLKLMHRFKEEDVTELMDQAEKV